MYGANYYGRAYYAQGFAGWQFPVEYYNPAHMFVQENGLRIDPLDGTISEYADETPNTMTLRLRGTRPTEGDTVVAWLGNQYASKKFGGTITSVQTIDGESTGNASQTLTEFVATCMDWALGLQEGPKVNKTYTNQTGNFIAADLIAMIPGYTGNHVQAGFVTVPSLVLKNASVMDGLKQLRDYLNTQYSSDVLLKVDYDKDVHLTVGADPSIKTPRQIDTSHPTLNNFTWTRDIQPIVTRAVTSGDGTQIAGVINPGDTVIPVVTAAMFQDGGGNVEVSGGVQRLSYTGRIVGVGGSLVGPGITPDSPSATLKSGTGIEDGQHDYTVVFRTTDDTHLTKESAVQTLIHGLVTPPASAPSATLSGTGGAVTEGVHTWSLTFGDGTNETTPSPVSASVTTWSVAPPAVAPTIANRTDGSWNPSSYNGTDLVYPTMTFVGINGLETSIGTDGSPITGSPVGGGGWHGIDITIPDCSSDPHIASINAYQSWAGSGGTRYLVGGTGPTGGVVSGPIAWFSGNTPKNQTVADKSVLITWAALAAAIAATPQITTLTLYRTTAGGSQQKKVTSFASTTTQYLDQIADGSLGANAPVTNAFHLNQTTLVLPLGPTGTTQRWVYRSAAGGGQRKLLHKVTDNTTMADSDSASDSTLGANAPTSDTSGLTQPSGQVQAGSITLLCAGVGWATPTGGWAACNGMIIRYTGLSGNTLTGIPASGPGSIVATINYNSTVTAASALTGIPASGVGSVVQVINQGDSINLLSIRNNTAAQAALAARLNSDSHTPASDGVWEDYVSLGAGVPQTAADRASDARLAQQKDPAVSASWASNDPTTTAGATVPINRQDLVTSLVIQQVTISKWNLGSLRKVVYTPSADEYPLYQVSQAGNRRYALDQFVRSNS